MFSADILHARQVERDALLAALIGMLQGDERIVAAWLYGSLGRGDADALSDIDLWVVVADEHRESVKLETREIISRTSKPLLVVDAPQNAPQGGAFLSVVYGGLAGGPQHVDWTWQTASGASVPHDARVLFNRDTVPRAASPSDLTREEKAKKAAKQMDFFWMMVPIVAKSIMRRQPWVTVNLLTLLRYTLDEISWLTVEGVAKPHYPTRTTFQPPANAAEQLAALRAMASELEVMLGAQRESDDTVNPATPQWIYWSIELAEQIIAEGLTVRGSLVS
jgi:predicted nucleotidyltransferase